MQYNKIDPDGTWMAKYHLIAYCVNVPIFLSILFSPSSGCSPEVIFLPEKNLNFMFDITFKITHLLEPKNQGHLFNLCNSKLKWRFCKERYNPINMKMISKEGLKYGYIGTKQAYNYFFLFVEVLMFQTHTYIHIHIYRYRLH